MIGIVVLGSVAVKVMVYCISGIDGEKRKHNNSHSRKNTTEDVSDRSDRIYVTSQGSDLSTSPIKRIDIGIHRRVYLIFQLVENDAAKIGNQ